MQIYKKINITKAEVVPVAREMREKNVHLAMIHAFIDKDGKGSVSYEYDVDGEIHSYTVAGENVLPDISPIYDLGAEWPEREIMELMDITFEGLDTSKRLFMPDSMLSGQGHILVTPIEDLIKETHKTAEEVSAAAESSDASNGAAAETAEEVSAAAETAEEPADAQNADADTAAKEPAPETKQAEARAI